LKWSKTVSNLLIRMGIDRCSFDQCIYRFQKKLDCSKVVLVIFVDDIVLASRDHVLEKIVVEKLCHKYEMSRTVKMSVFLGIEVSCRVSGVHK
jgi:Reverse transcriptase (RNA-dependent DNA polymerase)